MTTVRTDIHRPGAINPAEYQFVGIWYDPQHVETVGGSQLMEEERENIRQFMQEHGARWANHEHGGTCQCCGAHALYLAAFYHEHHNEVIRVGQDCAEKLGVGCEEAFNAARRKVASAKEYATGKARARLQLEELGLMSAWALWDEAKYYGSDTDEGIVVDMVRKLVTYGNLSDKQWEFLKRLMFRIENRAVVEAQRAAEKAAAQDCPTGRLDIVGTVLTTRVVEGHYGDTLKMFVKTTEGYTLWGTVPKGLTAERGQEVRFRATVEPSEKDPKHGYFSRPTAQKAEIAQQ
jgi:hypothetical protein